MSRNVAGYLLAIVCLLGLRMTETADAEKIKLKDGQQFEGQLLQKDGDRVILGVPRSAIATIEGKILPPPVTAGAIAPDFTAVDIAGASHSMSANKGKATLVQFWASWCPHCRSDLPKMKEMYAQDRQKGLELVTISVDQNPADLKNLVAKEQVSYPVILSKDYPDIPEQYEMQGIPAYYLVDAKGVIVKTWSGSITEGHNTDFEELITKTLAMVKP